MLSGFICACHGRMEMSGDQVGKFEAFCAAHPKHSNVEFTDKYS